MSDNFISLDEAKKLTANYRENLEKMLTPEYQGALSIAETFDAKAISAILDQKGCVSFRAYYGLDEKNQVCSIFVGVDEKGEDIIDEKNPVIIEKGIRCPEACPINLL